MYVAMVTSGCGRGGQAWGERNLGELNVDSRARSGLSTVVHVLYKANCCTVYNIFYKDKVSWSITIHALVSYL